MNSIQNLIGAYEDYLTHERKLAKSTVTGYLRDILMLSYFVGEKPACEINLDDIRGFMRQQSKDGFHTNTVRRRLHSYSTFWDWLRMEKITTENPIADIRVPKRKKPIPEWLTEDELKIFANTPANRENPRMSQRDSLAWKTLAWLGLRRGELLALRSEDVRLADRLVIIRDPKNGDDRALPLPDPLHTALDQWLGAFTQHDYVFHTRPYYKWQVHPFWVAFQVHLEVCGLSGRGITPHTIRHSFGTLMVARGVDVSIVSMLMGHKDIKNTMIYVHASSETLRKAMDSHTLSE